MCTMSSDIHLEPKVGAPGELFSPQLMVFYIFSLVVQTSHIVETLCSGR